MLGNDFPEDSCKRWIRTPVCLGLDFIGYIRESRELVKHLSECCSIFVEITRVVQASLISNFVDGDILSNRWGAVYIDQLRRNLPREVDFQSGRKGKCRCERGDIADVRAAVRLSSNMNGDT